MMKGCCYFYPSAERIPGKADLSENVRYKYTQCTIQAKDKVYWGITQVPKKDIIAKISLLYVLWSQTLCNISAGYHKFVIFTNN